MRPTSLSMLFTFPTIIDAHAFASQVINKIGLDVLDVSDEPPFQVHVPAPNGPNLLTLGVQTAAAEHDGKQEPDIMKAQAQPCRVIVNAPADRQTPSKSPAPLSDFPTIFTFYSFPSHEYVTDFKASLPSTVRTRDFCLDGLAVVEVHGFFLGLDKIAIEFRGLPYRMPDQQTPPKKTKREYSPRGLPLHTVPPVVLWQCQDCFRRADDYMVHNLVWRFAFEKRPEEARAPGALCFECLEHRLKRPLTIHDFPRDVPINRGIFLGASLTAEPSEPA